VNAAMIAKVLGGKASGDGFLVRCPVPSHGKGGGDRNPSLLIKDGDKTVLLKCFAGCNPQGVVEELRRRGLLAGDEPVNLRHAAPRCEAPTPKHETDPQALSAWRAARSISGTPVETFLHARGLTISGPPSLRFTMASYLGRYKLPAMVAAVQAPDRRIIAVQITLIDPRGDRKAQVRVPRKTVGALGWGAVRLAAAHDALGLAEGTEKALAAMQLLGVPCWSTLGAGRMHRVWVPDSVRELYIFADNDAAGRAAAERTAHGHRHRRVVIRFPPEQFKDWDDVTAALVPNRSAAA